MRCNCHCQAKICKKSVASEYVLKLSGNMLSRLWVWELISGSPDAPKRLVKPPCEPVKAQNQALQTVNFTLNDKWSVKCFCYAATMNISWLLCCKVACDKKKFSLFCRELGLIRRRTISNSWTTSNRQNGQLSGKHYCCLASWSSWCFWLYFIYTQNYYQNVPVTGSYTHTHTHKCTHTCTQVHAHMYLHKSQ